MEKPSTLDAAHLRELSALDDSGNFLSGLVRSFEWEFSDALRKLEACVDDGDRVAWRDACHAARSLAGSVGASALSASATRAMDTPPDTVESRRRTVEKMHDEYDRALVELRDLTVP